MIETVFLDRDGVINVNIPRGYVTSPNELTILPGVASAIKKLNDVEIPVVLISNQQGVGKGLMSLDQLDSVDAAMRSALLQEEGAELVRSYYCVHLSSDNCNCRKPKGGQLLNAAHDLSLNLATSIFIGDTPTDILAGRDAGVGHCALVLSGGTKTWVPAIWRSDPDSVHRDLAAAVEWIFAQRSDAEGIRLI